MIGKYNHETGKVEWFDSLPVAETGDSPAVWDDIEPHVGVGFPGQPVIRSRSHLRQLFRDNPNLVAMGSEGKPGGHS